MKESNMRLNETELREIDQRGTARSPSQADCLTADEIARISNGEIDEQERFRMANHLMLCSDCAEEYRLINPLQSIAALAAPERAAGQSQSNSVGSAHQSNYESVSGAPRRLVTLPVSARYAYIAAALLLAASFGLIIWSLSMRSANRRLTARLDEEIAKREQLAGPSNEAIQQADRKPVESNPPAGTQDSSERLKHYETEIAELRRNIDDLSRAQVNTPIVDLEPQGATRGESTGHFKLIELPSDAHLFTLVLNVSGQSKASNCVAEITDQNRQIVWKGHGLRKSAYNTFTLSLTRRLLPAGRYHLTLFAPGAQREQVEDYAVEIQYK